MKNTQNLLLIGLLILMGAVQAQDFNYGEALQKSIFFYEAQQAGELPDWNRVSWRGDSGLDHGKDVGLDLTGGWYDAGDHVKFNFPMASSVTMLAWGGIEFADAYEQSGQMVHLKRNLKFVLEYMMKCHIRSSNATNATQELYIQIGDGAEDHTFWVPAESFPLERESFKITKQSPGTDISAEFAAAFAASSILFKNSDPSFSAELVTHAEQLYYFADTYRAKYSDSYMDVREFYNSFSGFQDELVWGAAWLYRATNKMSYLTKAEEEYELITGDQGQGKPYSFAQSWDDKSYGSFVLLAQLTDDQEYKTAAQNHLDFWTVGYQGNKVTYSPGGQAHLVRWGSLRYAANTSFLALVYADKVADNDMLKDRYTQFALSQVDYALGDNPINRSFMCGFGNNPANDPHHRGNHGPWAGDRDGWPDTASHILYGALVGGPSSPDDQFEDDRSDYVANEVATDYNAAFTGALAALYGKYGGTPLANFPIEETPDRDEYVSNVVYYYVGPNGYNPSIRYENRTAWPARNTNKITLRYFFNISEAVTAGFSIDDIEVRSNGSSVGTIETKVWDEEKSIYYVEISLVGEDIRTEGRQKNFRDINLNLSGKNGAPFDPSNDFSAQGIQQGNSYELSPNIPVYDDGQLVYGQEPGGNVLSTDDFRSLGLTISPNPVKEVLTVSGNTSILKNARVDILSMTGARIQSVPVTQISGTLRVNTSELSPGVYFLQVVTSDSALGTVTKFVK